MMIIIVIIVKIESQYMKDDVIPEIFISSLICLISLKAKCLHENIAYYVKNNAIESLVTYILLYLHTVRAGGLW